MTGDEIVEHLYKIQDTQYKNFQAKLLPTVKKEKIIGVKTAKLRHFAKECSKDRIFIEKFLKTLPHKYFEENQLHAFIICNIKDFKTCIFEVENFLPYIDNWATTDQLLPKVFKKNHSELLPYIEKWILSEHTYTIRFAIGLFMQHFLDEDFDSSQLKKVSKLKSDEYYVKMMIAWYFATALAKQYKATLPYLEQKRLELWTHNKTIQKALESYRIPADKKEYLRTLKIKGSKKEN